jgi:hypothetical protein
MRQRVTASKRLKRQQGKTFAVTRAIYFASYLIA